MFWWIQTKLPDTLRGAWREIEEGMEVMSHQECLGLTRSAAMVVRHSQKVKGFIRETKERWGEREWQVLRATKRIRNAQIRSYIAIKDFTQELS
jgi:hypothetical protein